MIEIAICEEAVKDARKALAAELPGARSCHLYEALARALGFRTYAALRVAMRPAASAMSVAFDPQVFAARLAELGKAAGASPGRRVGCFPDER